MPRSSVILLFIVGFLMMFGIGLVRPFLPLFAEEVGASGVLVGLVVSSYFIARIFIELPSGLISDRIGRRTPITIGLLLSALSTLICGFSGNVLQLMLARAVWGVGAALFFSATTAFLLDLSEAKTRGRTVSTFWGIEFIGTFIGAPTGGYIAQGFGFRTGFFACAALTFLGFVLASVPLTFGKAKISQRSKHSMLKSLASLKNRVLAVTCFVGFARFFIMDGITITIFPLYANHDLNIETAGIGVLNGIRSLGFVGATLLAGFLSDAVGARLVILLGTVAASLVLPLYPLASVLDPNLMGVFHYLSMLMAFDGLASGLIGVTLPLLIAEEVDSSVRGGAIGVLRTFNDFGAVLGPISLMLINDIFNINYCFYAASGLLFLGFPLLLIVRQHHVGSLRDSDTGLNGQQNG